MLPLTEVPTMRRVVKVYQEWIQDNDLPIFMEDESEEEDEVNMSSYISYCSIQKSFSGLTFVRTCNHFPLSLT